MGRPFLGSPRVVLRHPMAGDAGLRYFSVLPRTRTRRPDEALWFIGRTGTGTHDYGSWLINTTGREPRLILHDISMSHNLVVRRFGNAYVGIGGQDFSFYWGSAKDGMRRVIASGKNEAESFAMIADGLWEHPSHDPGTRIFMGSHEGCITARRSNGICEFDGKVGAAFLSPTRPSDGDGTWHIFVRQNRKSAGGRWLAVLKSTAGVDGPYGPMRQLSVNDHPAGRGNVYFAAIDRHPLDPTAMLGLFPVNQGHDDCGNCDGDSYIGLGVSCDGEHWSRLYQLIASHGRNGRTDDHPVDGFMLDADGNVRMWVHHGVEHIHPAWQRESRIVEYTLSASWLADFTRRSASTLPGCAEPPSPRPPPSPLTPPLLPMRPPSAPLSPSPLPNSPACSPPPVPSQPPHVSPPWMQQPPLVPLPPPPPLVSLPPPPPLPPPPTLHPSADLLDSIRHVLAQMSRSQSRAPTVLLLIFLCLLQLLLTWCVARSYASRRAAQHPCRRPPRFVTSHLPRRGPSSQMRAIAPAVKHPASKRPRGFARVSDVH